jgi:hypothetical protein
MQKSHIQSSCLTWFTLLLSVILLTAGNRSSAQKIDYARFLMDSLSAPGLHGRGYFEYGAHQAAEFIVREIARNGIKPFSDSYSQSFGLNVNTFPGSMMVNIDGIRLEAGSEFIVSASTPSVNQVFELLFTDENFFENEKKIQKLAKKDLKTTLLAFDRSVLKGEAAKLADSLLSDNFLGAGGYLLINSKNKLVWSVWPGENQKKFPVIEIIEDALPRKAKNLALSIDAEYLNNHSVRNIIGYIPGSVSPDAFLVFTAHYDHLGRMGRETYFPGANDNASGVAMMLDLARHFADSTNQPAFSIAFIALAAEEMGLKGSEYYVENPLFPLGNIRFLINLDMVGTGSEGITVVNGTIYEEAFEKLVKINSDNNYIPKVVKRGESCNSDHCPFYQKGVPSIFIYSMGNEHREYHSIYDQSHRVPLTEYEDIFRLLRDFVLTY